MDSQGSVELREDAPLKAGGSSGGGGGWCGGGARAIGAGFGALSAAITVALLAQLYTGHYEWGAGGGAHGAVSTGAGVCSRAGTSVLQAGGRAMDAAVAAALCLAVVSPHLTSLDASGSMLFWEYRKYHSQTPLLAEWGAGGIVTGGGGNVTGDGDRPARLVAALAALHAKLGAASWPPLLQPAIDVASSGFTVSAGLAAARGVPALAGTIQTSPALATYLRSLQRNSSAELSAVWRGGGVAWSTPAVTSLAGAGGQWRLFAGGAGVGPALAAVESALPDAASVNDTDAVVAKVVERLIAASADGSWPPAGGAAVAGLAAVDPADNYVALTSGLSTYFGSGEVTADGWRRDEPTSALDFAPGMLVERSTCGSRYVLGGEGSATLAQGVAAIATEGPSGAEVSRAYVRAGSASVDSARALNYVWQRADALVSHADSRSGGLASRF